MPVENRPASFDGVLRSEVQSDLRPARGSGTPPENARTARTARTGSVEEGRAGRGTGSPTRRMSADIPLKPWRSLPEGDGSPRQPSSHSPHTRRTPRASVPMTSGNDDVARLRESAGTVRPVGRDVDIESQVSRDAAREETQQTQQTPRTALQGPTLQTMATAPRQASDPTYFTMQLARHAIPVGGTRTLVQGLAAPALAMAVKTHPRSALIGQGVLTTWSLARRILSQVHSESASEIANAAFSGDGGAIEAGASSTPRRLWQSLQSAGILAGDVVALALTAKAAQDPRLLPISQSFAAIQLRAHALSQGREFLRPTINTVHLGNDDPDVPRPVNGRNLRGEDVTWGMSAKYGATVGVVEFISQMLMQLTLGGRPAWEAGKGLATGAAAIAGVANTLSSSVEDLLIDKAATRRMQLADASHVMHVHWDAKNPLSVKEIARQLERVDARVFNQMMPAMIAAGIVYGLSQATPHANFGESALLVSTLNAVVSAVMLGGLLALTTRSYQLNDALREHRATPRSAPT